MSTRLSNLIIFALLLALTGTNSVAQTIAAKRTIRSKSVINFSDLVVLATETPGSITELADVAGMEARKILYPGRAILAGDVGPPAIVERNQIVTLQFTAGALSISVEGRALGRGGIGDKIRVMNLSSRATVFGWITETGRIRVSQ